MHEESAAQRAGMSRRSFTLGVGGATALLAMGSIKALPAEAQVRPPGGQDEDRLLSSCIRCERCIEACPRLALSPSHIEDGILGVRTPAANFDIGWCDFCEEENGGVPLCAQACPTSALHLEGKCDPKTTILGKAVIIRDWCLAWSKANGCRFCVDACPYEAMYMDKYKHPVVKTDLCNGCGACQNACVSLMEGSVAAGATSRAIIVVPEDQA